MHTSRMRTAHFGGRHLMSVGRVYCIPLWDHTSPGPYTPLDGRWDQTGSDIISPPMDRMTDTCKKTTFPQLRLWAVKIRISTHSLLYTSGSVSLLQGVHRETTKRSLKCPTKKRCLAFTRYSLSETHIGVVSVGGGGVVSA